MLLLYAIVATAGAGVTFANEDGTGIACPPLSVNIGGEYCATFSTTSGSWYDMEAYCNQLGTSLAKLESVDFHYYLAKYIYDNGLQHQEWWVGGTDKDHEGNWVYPDLTPVKMGTPFWGYSYGGLFNNQDPSGGTLKNCMALCKEYWHDAGDLKCTSHHKGICGYYQYPYENIKWDL
ncbi:unnamed protein product [Meganyctiphanes norvegica]|uniref:C-type lectin domain-containing protein n=1 Tax=Meganyctiphanes norvegica TaxID=48144 RepID=A0AAV2R727_MEGNR